MGHYTEFVFGVSLKSTTPKEVIAILDYLVNNVELDKDLSYTNHEFFKCSRFIAIATSSSYYFGYSESLSAFSGTADNISKEYLLSIRSNLKNYDNEIDKFVDWIRPYVNSGSGSKELLGYKSSEQSVIPYLFYKDKKFEQSVNTNINAGSYIEELY